MELPNLSNAISFGMVLGSQFSCFTSTYSSETQVWSSLVAKKIDSLTNPPTSVSRASPRPVHKGRGFSLSYTRETAEFQWHSLTFLPAAATVVWTYCPPEITKILEDVRLRHNPVVSTPVVSTPENHWWLCQHYIAQHKTRLHSLMVRQSRIQSIESDLRSQWQDGESLHWTDPRSLQSQTNNLKENFQNSIGILVHLTSVNLLLTTVALGHESISATGSS